MKVARISPSKLERFRQFIDGEMFQSVTEQSVIDSITGTAYSTPQAEYGTAYHYAIEKGPERFFDSSLQKYVVHPPYVQQPILFGPEQMAPAIAFRNRYPGMAYELKHEWALRVNGVQVLMPMRIDGALGLHIHEQKTTRLRSYIDGYTNSLQWKIYLLSTGAQRVQYNVFYIEEPADFETPPRIFYDNFQLFPTPTLMGDIQSTLVSYLEFVENRDLHQFVYLQ